MEQGKITTVEYRDGVTLCNVQPVRNGTDYRNVPMVKRGADDYRLPEVGQTVVMDKLDDGTRFIIGVLATNDDADIPSDVGEGDVTMQFDAGTKISITETAAGYSISIAASDNVTIDGIDFDEHTHDYTWGDQAGSGTTDGPQ